MMMSALPTGTAVMCHGKIMTIVGVAARSMGKLSSQGVGWYDAEYVTTGAKVEIWTGPIHVIDYL